jgi:hypothetical protein
MSEFPPEPTLRRVLALSLMDGWCMSLFSGFCTLLSLLMAEWSGAVVGAVVLSCGLTTLRNRRRLVQGVASGITWLLRAQLMVILVVFLFVLKNLLAFDPAAMHQKLVSLESSSAIGGLLVNLLSAFGLSVSDFLPFLTPVYFGFYLLVMSGTLVFQGGLALFYLTRRAQVTEELAARVGQSV